nr:MAG TPA: chitin synthase regulator [Caudoviricetes sp.]
MRDHASQTPQSHLCPPPRPIHAPPPQSHLPHNQHRTQLRQTPNPRQNRRRLPIPDHQTTPDHHHHPTRTPRLHHDDLGPRRHARTKHLQDNRLRRHHHPNSRHPQQTTNHRYELANSQVDTPTKAPESPTDRLSGANLTSQTCTQCQRLRRVAVGKRPAGGYPLGLLGFVFLRVVSWVLVFLVFVLVGVLFVFLFVCCCVVC